MVKKLLDVKEPSFLVHEALEGYKNTVGPEQSTYGVRIISYAQNGWLEFDQDIDHNLIDQVDFHKNQPLYTYLRLAKLGLLTYNSEKETNTMSRGRKATFADKFSVVEALKTLQETGLARSRYLTLQLVKEGYVTASKEKVTPGRGRSRVKYELSGKGRGYLALSKNWKKAAD